MAILVATLAAVWLAGVHVRDHGNEGFQDPLLEVLLVGIAPLPITALPLALSRDPVRFRQASLRAAAALAGASLIFASFGWFLYLPAALLLLLAALIIQATSRRIVALGVLVCLATTGALTAAIHQSFLRPPNAYEVHLRPGLTFWEALRVAEQARQLPDVEHAPNGTTEYGGVTRVRVFFEVGLLTADKAKMARLERQLRELPDVTRLELCRC
jgi:hypothetical protein